MTDEKPPHLHPIVPTPSQWADWHKKVLEIVTKEQSVPSVDRPSLNPLNRETLEMALEDFQRAEQRGFLDPQLQTRIGRWCAQDHRVNVFWLSLTRNVHRGLSDEIVDGVMRSLSTLLRDVDRERNQRNKAHFDNIQSLDYVIRDVLESYEDAISRGDPEYLRPLIEELEAVLHAITVKERHGSE